MRVTLDFIHNSNLIENINSAKEDRQSWDAWTWFSQQEMISQPTLLELHAKITRYNLSKQYRGSYRDVDVTVGGRLCPTPFLAKQQIYNWLYDMQEWKKHDPKKMHVRFEKIHPFIDGNGRTGRMLMWWHELQTGKPATMISFANRRLYYDWFKEGK